jgi:hypothetical protein
MRPPPVDRTLLACSHHANPPTLFNRSHACHCTCASLTAPPHALVFQQLPQPTLGILIEIILFVDQHNSALVEDQQWRALRLKARQSSPSVGATNATTTKLTTMIKHLRLSQGCRMCVDMSPSKHNNHHLTFHRNVVNQHSRTLKSQYNHAVNHNLHGSRSLPTTALRIPLSLQ